jgi:hypothetical protein
MIDRKMCGPLPETWNMVWRRYSRNDIEALLLLNVRVAKRTVQVVFSGCNRYNDIDGGIAE